MEPGLLALGIWLECLRERLVPAFELLFAVNVEWSPYCDSRLSLFEFVFKIVPNGPAAKSTNSSYWSGFNWWRESNVWCVGAVFTWDAGCSRSVICILYRSLGANNELLLTWINSNGAKVPLEIAYGTNLQNIIYVSGNLLATRSVYVHFESILPKIVSQLGNRVGWWGCPHCADC